MTQTSDPHTAGSSERPLRQLAALYLKLGTIAFGGPAAHIALMEDEVVRRRRWLTRDAFLDLLGVASLLPGPSSTETALFIGYRRAGIPGLLVAGVCFILPAMLMVGVLAWAYVANQHLPAVQGILYGVRPVVIAIIAQALWRLGTTAVKTPLLAGIGAAALLAALFGLNLVAVLISAGVVAMVRQWSRVRQHHCLLLPLAGGLATVPATAAATPSLLNIFLIFLKFGSVVFGSGYVLLAFLQHDLIAQHHWLTEAQLNDAIVVGQVTPGPVFTTATFIGYLLGGPWGALLATAGIFLPAFGFVAITGPLVRKLRQSSAAGAFLDGVNVGSLALMAMVTCQLGSAALVDPLTLGVAAASLVLLLWKKLNSVWLILPAALLGLAHASLQVHLVVR